MIFSTESKIRSLESLKHDLAIWRFRNDKIVFTNGCFDILHPGHINYLEQAASLGHRLIIGLNSDLSVKMLKGQNRPVLSENIRARLLAALHCTDAIILFNEETPEILIKSIKPDILVKGGDYLANQVVGAEFVKSYSGQVVILPFVEGYSSSTLINKLVTSLTDITTKTTRDGV